MRDGLKDVVIYTEWLAPQTGESKEYFIAIDLLALSVTVASLCLRKFIYVLTSKLLNCFQKIHRVH